VLGVAGEVITLSTMRSRSGQVCPVSTAYWRIQQMCVALRRRVVRASEQIITVRQFSRPRRATCQ